MSRADADAAVEPSAVAGSWSDPVDAARLLVPLPPTGVVRRARLHKRLDEGVQGPLTLVTAPAGTGKSVLASSWAAERRVKATIVWLSLDSSCIGLGRFWQLVVMSLSRLGLDGLPPASAGSDATEPSFMASVAGRILDHHEPVVLILDCDVALPIDVTSGLDVLVKSCGGRLRVVLVTRQDPLLPLHRYRLAGTVAEIRMADLAFTTAEAREMLSGTGVDLSPAAMDAVTSRTQGWAAGLRMAAMSLAHRANREDAALRLAGDTGILAEYLLAEVLDSQPKGVRQLLLDTSVVDVLLPGLVAALAGPQAERAFSFLVRANAFLEELPDLTGCYRYHQLFRDLLRAQLAYETPARAVKLQRVAAIWLADHGLVLDAARHAIATADWETAAGYVVDDLSIAALLTARPTNPLADALRKIPRTSDGVAISIVNAARALAADDLPAAAAGIRRMHRPLETPAGDAWPAAELAVSLLELMCALLEGDAVAALDAATVAESLMRRQAPGSLAAHPEFGATVQFNVGAALLLAGKLDAAADAFRAATETVCVAGCEQPLIDALGFAALLTALGGDLRRSADLAAHAVQVSSAAGLKSSLRAAEVALAYAHTEMYDLGSARRHVVRATGCGPTSNDPLPKAMLALASARICRADGDVEGALTVLGRVLSEGGLPGWLADRLGLEQVKLLVADGRTARAVEFAQQLSEPRSRDVGLQLAGVPACGPGAADPPAMLLQDHGDPRAVRVDTLLQSAARNVAAGSVPLAVRELERALRLAAPELLRRPFRDAPKELRGLLRRQDVLMSNAWLTGRQAGSPPGGVPHPRSATSAVAATQEPAQMIQPLTDKEREVLGHLSDLLSTEEIAAQMFITVNTVRTHVRNILRKLAASRRNEAVRRARVLKIIPS